MLTNQGFATEATSWKLVLHCCKLEACATMLPCFMRVNAWLIKNHGISLLGIMKAHEKSGVKSPPA